MTVLFPIRGGQPAIGAPTYYWAKIYQNLHENLLYGCATARVDDLISVRKITPCVGIVAGDKHLGIKGLSGEYLTHTDRALPPFLPADHPTLAASESYELPDLYPISPLIDLKKQHVWRDENLTGKNLTGKNRRRTSQVRIPLEPHR